MSKKTKVEKIFISDADHDQMVKQTKITIQKLLDSMEVKPELKTILKRAKFIYNLPKKKQADAIKQIGSACIPRQSDFVIIGMFGSIWMDTIYMGKPVRIAFNPDPKASIENCIMISPLDE